jgi:hypothetical protein
MSNALSFRLSGDPANPKVCVKVLKFTGDCSITGTCPNTGITYTTGYTVTEYCSSKTLYEYCEQSNPNYLNREHWSLRLHARASLILMYLMPRIIEVGMIELKE